MFLLSLASNFPATFDPFSARARVTAARAPKAAMANPRKTDLYPWKWILFYCTLISSPGMSSTCQFFGLTAFQAWAVRVDGPPLAGDEGRGGVFSVQLTHHAGLIHPLQVVVEQVGVPGTLEEKFYYVNLSKKSTNLFSLWTLTGSSALARPQCRKSSQPLCPFRKKVIVCLLKMLYITQLTLTRPRQQERIPHLSSSWCCRKRPFSTGYPCSADAKYRKWSLFGVECMGKETHFTHFIFPSVFFLW